MSSSSSSGGGGDGGGVYIHIFYFILHILFLLMSMSILVFPEINCDKKTPSHPTTLAVVVVETGLSFIPILG